MTHDIKALVFDVFGSVVDGRGSIARDHGRWGAREGVQADWAALADAWRARYQPQMERVRSGALPFVPLDALHREALDDLLPAFGLGHLDDAERRHVNAVWHRLDPWPDAIPGLVRLKHRFIVGTLSNGNVALQVAMARRAALPWDVVFSAEHFGRYKPQPETYLGAARMLALEPRELMMCAAHNGDLRAARECGLATAFFARPTEYGPGQASDLAADDDWDVVADDIEDLARRLGC
ncbi:MAG TPA: haloacid dehalogenase type II [Ideonella sp.]|nr:haloacid dehalogenase type II [Ideonella sp.]